MKIYNVTRWMKVAVTVMVEGEAELECVRKMNSEKFVDFYYTHTDNDEQRDVLQSNYEQIGEQEVEFVDEQEEDE